MGHRYHDLLFSASVKAVQSAEHSRDIYRRWEQGEDHHALLGQREVEFLTERDSFYLASVSPDGWPYIQHRGGPTGFIRVLDERHIGFADYRGNRQYISTGNLRVEKRVALFVMDYPNRRRLKLLGNALEIDADSPQLAALCDPQYPARVERGFLIEVAAFDWNCSQHITPRYDQATLERIIADKQETR